MSTEAIGRTKLSSATVGSPCSYELCGEQLIGKLFGIFPCRRIHLGAIHYLRLATSRETSPLYLIFNWPRFFLSSRRAVSPTYILQTRKGQRIFLTLGGSEHFRLRQAIGRHSDRRNHKLAA